MERHTQQVPANKRRQLHTLPGPPGKLYRVSISGPCDNGYNTSRLIIPYAEFGQEQYVVRIEAATINFGVSYTISNQPPTNPPSVQQLFQAPSALVLKTKGLCVPRYLTDGSTDPVCLLYSTKNGSGNDQVLDLNVTAATPTLATYTSQNATPVSLFASYNNIRGVQKRALYGENYCIETLGDVVTNTNLTFEFQWSVDMAPRISGVLTAYDNINAIPFAPTIDFMLLFYPNPLYNRTVGVV